MTKIDNYSALKIAKILEVTPNFKDFKISSISIDSREKNQENSCFFAIKGEKYNGHNYVNEAIKNGARLIVADEKIDASVPIIYVKNTVKSLGKLASIHKGKTRVIGVTGSVGKTTVKDMIFNVIKQQYKVIATSGNFNNEIGVPLTLLRLKNEDFCVLEMGMRGLNEMDYLSSISRPETAVVTNALTSHIERLKTKENIFFAKCEILNYQPKFAVLPNENRFKSLNLQGIYPFFIDFDCKVIIENVTYTENGITFDINHNNKVIREINLKSFSRHNIYNSIIAFLVGNYYGISCEKIKKGIEEFTPSYMRGNIEKIGNIIIINDSYNASYESVMAGVNSMKEYCKYFGKRMNVFIGDILEIGEESKRVHHRLGMLLKDEGIKNLFLYGENVKYTKDGFGGGILFNNKEDISNYILNTLDENDVLLVKASRKMHFEEIICKMKEKKNE